MGFETEPLALMKRKADDSLKEAFLFLVLIECLQSY
ncbi:YqxA fragment [Bacillus velezensis NAU-B3]|nr:YqxA fragment [Bacillus velezensis NAU-B3]